MIHSCIGLEFLSPTELYVLTNHKDGEYIESRIFSYNLESGLISPYFIFENWIKRFRILGEKRIYASQWDDTFYMTSETEDEEHHFTIKCITAFDMFDDGSVVLVGMGGRASALSKDGKTTTIATGLSEDILNCKVVGQSTYFCGSRGLFGKIDQKETTSVIELGTDRFLTCVETNAEESKLLVSGRGILIEIEDGELRELAREMDFYESTEVGGDWYVTAGTDGLFRVVDSLLELVTQQPSFCIATSNEAIAVGGLDEISIIRHGETKTITLDANVLEQIHVF